MKEIIEPVDTEDGLFHDGDTSTGAEGTIVYAKIMNAIQGAVISNQQELISVLKDAEIKIDPTKQDQLLSAIKKVTATATKGFLNVGDYGLGRTVGEVTHNIDFNSFAFTQGSHLFVNMSSCTNIPAGLGEKNYYFMFVHGLRDEDSEPGLTIINYLDPNEVWTAYGAGKAGSRNWKLTRTYNTGFKPSPADINAYSKKESDGRYAYKSITVNGQSLSSNVNLTANDVNAWNKTEADGRFIYKSGDTIEALNVNKGLYVAGNMSTSGTLYVTKTAGFGDNISIGSALIQTDGNIKGGAWGGGYLSEWISSRSKISGSRNAWWYKDEVTGLIFQGGVVNRTGYDTRVNFPRAYVKECFGIQLTITLAGGGIQDSRDNVQARNLDNNGFSALMNINETVLFWQSVGV